MWFLNEVQLHPSASAGWLYDSCSVEQVWSVSVCVGVVEVSVDGQILWLWYILWVKSCRHHFFLQWWWILALLLLALCKGFLANELHRLSTDLLLAGAFQWRIQTEVYIRFLFKLDESYSPFFTNDSSACLNTWKHLIFNIISFVNVTEAVCLR